MNSKKIRTENVWRDKAVSRREENKALIKRIREITTGREAWKAKAMSFKEEIKRQNLELDSIKKKLKKIITN